MRIRKITLREMRMKLVTPFQISVGSTDVRRILLVEADVDGVTGWGECVAGETPMYSPETTDTAWHILRDFLWPLIKDKEFHSAADVWGLLELVRGHNMAKARWKPPSGTRRRSRRVSRCDNSSVERELKSPPDVSIGIKDSIDGLF